MASSGTARSNAGARTDGAGPSGSAGRDGGPGPRRRLVDWLLLEASRLAVAGGLLVALFVVFVALGALDPAGLRTAVDRGDPIDTTFQGLLTTIVTGVTIVVTINQLVLSQELGAVGDQRERMEGSLSFRDDVEDLMDARVAPVEPSAFLSAMVEESRNRAVELGEAAADGGGAELEASVDGYVTSLVETADRVSRRLADARFGTFAVLSAVLEYDYSRKIYDARRLRSEHDPGDDLADEFDRLITVLQLFGPAREHFKTLYFQWELINLSRAVLYAAVPALVVAAGAILYLDDPGRLPGSTLGVDNLVWAVSGAVVVGLLPFALLLSYILRIATVAKRTLAIGPFVLSETAAAEGHDRD